MRITTVESTDLFVGPAGAPRQVIRVTLAGGPPGGTARVRIEGPMVSTPEPALATGLHPGRDTVVEVGVLIAAPAREGSAYRVTAIAEIDAGADPGAARCTAPGEVRAAATGWTMWMISHFHYDPVWWNTQRGFTEVWQDLPDVPGVDRLRPAFVRTAFDLVRAHLDAAHADPDYRFVLAEIDYLKPYWDSRPRDRAELRELLREGRVELVGGMYNEPNTNLTHPESTIRNTVYGVGYQRDVLGGDPRTAWMLDVFGHDPAFPGLMADAGLTSSAWARGPYHHVGAKRHTGDITRMQFPSEFEWISPTGRGLLTAYMANHYVAGWDVERKETLAEAMAEAYAQFSDLRRVAATRNVLLPVGHDHNIPSRWCTEVHRAWADRYVWPRFVLGLPRDFFAAVRAELAGGAGDAGRSPGAVRRAASPQTRDMNPVYTGKDVSYIDTKQAQRAVEVQVLDAERLATLAALLGDRFPSEALDKAWRLLAYGAHHDAVTGTESDQVYLDLLAGWREAYELSAGVRATAVSALARRIDTDGAGQAVLAVNPLSWVRTGMTSVRLGYAMPGPAGVEVRDEEGAEVPAVAEGVLRHEDGTVAELTLWFRADDVPSLGYRVFRVIPADRLPGGWRAAGAGPAMIENEAFRIEADPERGGALSRIVDLRAGRDLLRPGGLGGELLVQDEYAVHPHWGEGPWHLLPKGPGRGLGERPAEVRVEHSALGSRIVSVATLGELRVRQEVSLWRGVDRVDFRTHVDSSIGQDRLLRVRFDLDLPGALPVSEVGYAAIGRPFGFPDSDAGEQLWTLDNPAHTWAGLSCTARIALRGPDGTSQQHAFGVAEVVAAPARHEDRVRALLVRLVGQGVTATCTDPDGPRYGALDADSNLPDVRIVLGAANSFAEAVLAAAGPAYRATLARTGRVFVPAVRPRAATWVPDADLRGPRDLPVLVVTGGESGTEDDGLAAAIDRLADDLADGVIEVERPDGLAGTAEPLTDYSVAVVNQGTPGSVIAVDGTLHLSLMRACTGWPSGVWIDGPRRTAPDGSGFALQHWTHTFGYSLVAGEGDWRRAGFVRAGQEVNHPVRADAVPARAAVPGDVRLPRRASLGAVQPENVLLAALKPRGNPMAAGLSGTVDPGAGVTLRLYESSGTPTTARVSLLGGLRDAAVTDVLEAGLPDRPGAPVPGAVQDGADLLVEVGAADVVTVAAHPAGARITEPTGGPATEIAQPVFTRYWLHNNGPAPLGALPVAVHAEPASVALPDPVATAEVRITVAATGSPAAGRVSLDVPAGLTAVATGAVEYDLAPGGYAEFTVTVGAAGVAPGRYFLAARIHDDLGQVLEDVVSVTVGTVPGGQPADIAEIPVEISMTPERIAVPPGGRATLTLRLANRARSEVRGEAQLISPYGAWGAPEDGLVVEPHVQGFALPAGGAGALTYTVRAPGTARPGSHWWALAKVGCFGGVAYSAVVALEVV